jgi:hypothetical protein
MKNNSEMIDSFIKGFYGYGNYEGEIWYIGMEEGGGKSLDEIKKRLNAWEKRKRAEVEDLVGFHREIGLGDYFNEPAKLQRTWNALIRIFLCYKGQEPFCVEDVRGFQQESFGRSDGDICLLELFPLPSPGTASWLYGKHFTQPYLASRKKYHDTFKARREEHLKQKIEEHKPKIVVFYGLGYRPHWEQIAQITFQWVEGGFLEGSSDSTNYIIAKHPASVGVKHEYFHNIGRYLNDKLGNK